MLDFILEVEPLYTKCNIYKYSINITYVGDIQIRRSLYKTVVASTAEIGDVLLFRFYWFPFYWFPFYWFPFYWSQVYVT